MFIYCIFFGFFLISGVRTENLKPSVDLQFVERYNVTNPNNEDVIFSENNTLKMVEGTHMIIYWRSNVIGASGAIITISDEIVSVVIDHEEFLIGDGDSLNEYYPVNLTTQEDDVTIYGYFTLSATFVGYNKITVTLLDDKDKPVANGTLSMAVLLKKLYLTKVYTFGLTATLILVYTTMGANLDLNLVKQIGKKPIGPLIGLFCQYGCMPVIAFVIGLLVFPDDPLLRLGLFASGSSPGGGLSNMWTHLLGGSLDLSIMMTFASTVTALAAVPMWLLTVGTVIVKDANFVIPFVNVIVAVFILIVPCFVGIIIQLKFERLTKFLRFVITPLSIFNIIFIFTFGVYANLYLFSLITWQAVAGGFGQSICGHLAGILFAVLFRRNKKDIIAISVETAVQNNGIAFLLLKLSLESPAGDLAVLMPGCVTLFMPLPLAIACFIRMGYLMWRKKKYGDTSEVDKSTSKTNDDSQKSSQNTSNANEETRFPNGIDNPNLHIEEHKV